MPSLVGIKLDLAQTDRVGGDLDAFVLGNKLERLLQRQVAGGREADQFVCTRCAHVRQLLLARRIDVHILAASVDANHHAAVDHHARLDEHLAALLQREHCVRCDGSLTICDQRTIATRTDLAVPGLKALQDMVKLARASCLRQELGAETNQATSRHDLFDPHPTRAVVDHLLHATLADTEQLDHHTSKFFRHINRQTLHWLVALAINHARHNLRLTDRQLETLTAHRLDEHSQLQLAAALDLPRVRALRRGDAKRHVADQLLIKAVLQHRGRQLGTALTSQRRRVDADRHRQARLVDGEDRQRTSIGEVGDGLANRHLGDTSDCDDVTRASLVRRDALELFGNKQFGQLDVLNRSVGTAPGDGLALAEVPVADAAQRQTTQVRRGVEVRHQCLQRMVWIVLRCGDVIDDRVEQRHETLGQRVGTLIRSVARTRIRVHDREIDLLLSRVQVEEQRVRLVEYLGNAGVGTVDLVDDENHGKLGLKRLAQHEARLRQRPLARVDEKHNSIDHRQTALDLATEIGMARGVNDVDLDVAVTNRRVLGEDRDALLALQIVRVHDALADVLIDTEGTGLPKHGVDESRLTMINMRDDRDVPDRVAAFH